MTRNGRSRSGVTEAEWSKFDQTLTDVRVSFADLSAMDVEDLIDQALIGARHSNREASSPQGDKEHEADPTGPWMIAPLASRTISFGAETGRTGFSSSCASALVAHPSGLFPHHSHLR